MHGINTQQSFIYLPPILISNVAGQPQQAAIQIFTLGNAASLNNNIPDFDGTTQFYLKRLYTSATYTNVNHIPCVIEYNKMVCRRDLTTADNVTSFMNQDVQTNTTVFLSANTPWLSPFTGDTFRKSFKLITRKRMILTPGKCKTFHMGVQKNYLRKAISGEDEGSATYGLRKGNLIYLFRFYGMPVNYSDGSSINSQTCLGPVNVRGLSHDYCSYYRMDDVEPTSTIGWTERQGIITSNIALLPSYTIAVHGTDPAGNVVDRQHVLTAVDT